jgi:hypothetical protein
MVDIYDWNDLDAVRNDLTASYTLQNDLDSSTAGYAGIGDDFNRIGVAGFDGAPFSGTFDGQGRQISDFVLGDDGGANRGHGLFGGVGDGGVVENLSISGVVDLNGFSADTSAYIGGLAGAMGQSGTGTISNCASHIDVTSPTDAGGLVGNNDSGTVTDCYATGAIDADGGAGGLAYENSGTIQTSYAVGSVTGNFAGGLVDGNTGTITDSYWDTQSTGQSTSGGGTGLTTSEMRGDEASANMGGFDFVNTWDTVLAEDSDASADGYPILSAIDRQNQLEAQGIYVVPKDGIYVDGTEYDCLVDGTQYDVVQN